jgi:N-methylhydantoinase B
VFEGEAVLDDDGHGREDIRVVARVTKQGSDVEVDLTGSDPQTTSFSTPRTPTCNPRWRWPSPI